MRPVTIGTAGHIDHGKSALVRALTGTDPDRLAEEQRRGMTLDLGFAHLDLPSGVRAGIVDVPGHEALVHNMLAGAGGIDGVVLVVAADEGVMPQTREHLHILRFLRVDASVVALTKIDLVDDPGWLDAVEEELREALEGTPLSQAQVVRVSARTGEGLPLLVAALDASVRSVPSRPSSGPARLPVDRSFTMSGFGTVVTGTLWSGTIRAGEVLALMPEDRQLRVRGIQVHGESAAEASAGSRVAVNLAGIEKQGIRRGDLLCTPGAFRPTRLIDVKVRSLPEGPGIRSADRVHLHLGADQITCRVSLAGGGELSMGREGLARLRLERPTVAAHGDRFVLRRYSPTEVVGGGVVLDPAPQRRKPGVRSPAVLLDVEKSGPPALIVAAAVRQGRAGLLRSEAASVAGLAGPDGEAAVASAIGDGRVVAVAERLFAAHVVEELGGQIEAAVADTHARSPWRWGIPRDELKSRVSAAQGDRLFDEVLARLLAEARVCDRGGLLALPPHTPRFTDEERALRAKLLSTLEGAGFSPPPLSDLQRLAPAGAVDRMLQSLADERLVVAVSPELRFPRAAVELVHRAVVEMARSGGEVTVGSLRDRLQTSRRYALALLEYLDTARITRRVGDRRVLGPNAELPGSTPRS